MADNDLQCECPYCGFLVTIPRYHFLENDKICCMNCNKAFPLPKKEYGAMPFFNINGDDDSEGF